MSVEKKIWIASCVISAGLAWVLFMLWVEMNRFEGDLTQLHDEAAVEAYFNEENVDPAYEVKTGIYVQSLEFEGATDVRVSGYIWQIYEDGIHDAIRPEPGEMRENVMLSSEAGPPDGSTGSSRVRLRPLRAVSASPCHRSRAATQSAM